LSYAPACEEMLQRGKAIITGSASTEFA